MDKLIPGDTLLIKPKAQRATADDITETVKASEFLAGATHVMLLFSGPSWCGPCRQMEAPIERQYEAVKANKFANQFPKHWLNTCVRNKPSCFRTQCLGRSA